MVFSMIHNSLFIIHNALMCRFALIQSQQPIEPKPFLTAFAEMAEKSKAPDGDRQADGWGIAWLEGNRWRSHKSLLPIWNDSKMFESFPKTSAFLVHARSAFLPT